MNNKSAFTVLLYYKFVKVDNAEQFAQEHLAYCKELGIKGRILIADEGINGTLSGTPEQAEKYMNDLRANPLFSDIVFKIDTSDQHVFKKMFVRYKKELVTFRYEDSELDPNVIGGKRLSPKEWHDYLQREDVIILDGRNGYEFDIGHFRGAIRPEVESFREFPEWIRENMKDLKDKPILTYCTGGIRCEKLSGFLIEEGFQDVYQLEGGIVTYGQDEEVKGHLWTANAMYSMSAFLCRSTVPTRISWLASAITAGNLRTVISTVLMTLAISSIFAVRNAKRNITATARTSAAAMPPLLPKFPGIS